MATRKKPTKINEPAPQKAFWVSLSVWQVGKGGMEQGNQILEALTSVINGSNKTFASHYGITVELYGLKASLQARGVFGRVRKHRRTDLPETGKIGDPGKPLELEADEALLEGNYFGFYPDQSVLVWVTNSHGVNQGAFGTLMTAFAQSRIPITPVVTHDAIERLLRDGVTIRAFDVTIPVPKNQSFTPQSDFSKSTVSLMQHFEDGVFTISGKTTAKMPASASSALKSAMLEFVRGWNPKRAKVELEDDGEIHPVDFLLERLVSKIGITSAGSKLMPGDYENAIGQAYEQHLYTLKKLYGTD